MPLKTGSPRISAHQETVVAVLRAAGVIRREVVKLLQVHRLSPSQYNVLRILRGSPDGLATMEIASRLIDEDPAITRLIDGVEKMELVERVRSPLDRRRIDCRLTEKGRELLGQLDGPLDQLDQRLLRGLAKKELRQLTELLSRIHGE